MNIITICMYSTIWRVKEFFFMNYIMWILKSVFLTLLKLEIELMAYFGMKRMLHNAHYCEAYDFICFKFNHKSN
jgi:hypothetical protein